MANTLAYEMNPTTNSKGWFARARQALADYSLYRQTLAELESLNDRELRDLGLSRLSIRDVAYDSVYGG